MAQEADGLHSLGHLLRSSAPSSLLCRSCRGRRKEKEEGQGRRGGRRGREKRREEVGKEGEGTLCVLQEQNPCLQL